jgi:hypothetical protein
MAGSPGGLAVYCGGTFKAASSKVQISKQSANFKTALVWSIDFGP